MLRSDHYCVSFQKLPLRFLRRIAKGDYLVVWGGCDFLKERQYNTQPCYRQQIWERDGERTFEVDHSSGDYPRWIDTSVMLADPLTKAMNSDAMGKVMTTGVFDMKPTEESLMIKEKNRLSRKKAKGQAVEDDQGDG